MKNFLIILFFSFLLLAESLFSDTKLDSLFAKLNETQNNPHLLFDIANEYYKKNNLNKSIEYFDKAASAAFKINDFLLFIRAKHNVAQIKLETGNEKKLLKDFQSTYKFVKNDKKLNAYYFFYLANLYFTMGDFKTAKKFYKKSKRYFEDLKLYNKQYFSCLLDLSQVYSYLGEKNKAISIHFKALEKAEPLKNFDILYDIKLSLANEYFDAEIKDKAMNIYYEILSDKKYHLSLKQKGYLYYILGSIISKTNKTLAKEYLKKAIKIYRQEKDYFSLLDTYNSLAIIYADEKKYNQAQEYYLKALQLAKKLNNEYGISLLYNNLGEIYREQKNYDKAMDYYLKALELYKPEYYDDNLAAVIYLNIATVNYNKKAYKQAFENLKKIKTLNKNVINRSTFKDIYQLYSELYEKSKNYKRSLEYLKKYLELEKSINTQTSEENINKLQLKIETLHMEEELKILKKDKKIKELQIQQAKLKNRYYIIITLLLFLGVVFLGYSYIITKKSNLQIKDMNKKLDELSRIDPLTKLSNRRDILEKIEYEVIRAKRNKKPISFLLCDLDHFKKINDKYGHDCGDEVLKKVAETFTSTLRQQDLISRWGGEEFLIVLLETDRKNSYDVAEKVRKNIENLKIKCLDKAIKITITIGISEYEEDTNIDDIIKRADMALYIGKSRGRNCSVQIL